MKVKVLNTSVVDLPKYATKNSAGLDLMSACKATIPANSRGLIPTGLHLEIPEGYELQVRPRSGLALKSGITVLNAPGTIDADYRGEIGVILFNTTNEDFHIEVGDRIAQAVLTKHETIEWEETQNLNETERGAGGFGHSGK